MCTPWKKYLHATEQVTQLFGSQDDCKKIVGLLKPAIADVQAESYSTQNKPDEQQSRGNTQAETFTVLQTCIAQNSNYRQTQHTLYHSLQQEECPHTAGEQTPTAAIKH